MIAEPINFLKALLNFNIDALEPKTVRKVAKILEQNDLQPDCVA